jgi:hypothetical protein
LPNDAGEDSYNILPALLGQPREQPICPYTLHQTISNALAIRRGPWKLLDHKGSGGNRYDDERMRPFALPDTDPDAPGQLYDLAADPGETRNLYSQQPEIVAEMKATLQLSKSSGRSAPQMK